MYGVSDAYKTAIKKETRTYDLELTITSNKGQRVVLGRQDIVKNSFSITHQCCSNTEIEIGSVYSAELSVTILSNLDRYTLSNGTIEAVFKLETASGWESVPLGKFVINEANKKISCIEIMANDYMIRFEKSFTNTNTMGTPYDLLSLCSGACDVVLAQTKKQIEQMPNGKESLTIYEDNDIETYRDLIFYIAQTLGGFATMTRDGKLEIRKYGNYVVSTIKGKHRFSSDFSDFITKYTAVSSTNVRSNISEYEALETDDALTMNLGVNPLLQYGTEETRKKILRNILDQIAIIEYVPFSCTMLCDPSFDLGDCLIFEDLHADADHISCITSYSFTFNGDFTLSCSGKNPLLAQAKSKNEKNIQGLLNQSSKNEVIIYSFTNAKSIQVNQTKTEIISIAFVTKNKTSAEFSAEVVYQVNADTNALVSYIYEIDSNELTTHMPEAMKLPGKAFDTLYYPLSDVKEESVHTFRVYMKTATGTVGIERFQVVAAIRGQGLVSDVVPWDGTIKIDEEFEILRLGSNMNILPIIEAPNSIVKSIPKHAVNEQISVIRLASNMIIKPMREHVYSNPVIEKNTIDMTGSYIFDQYYVKKDESFMLNTEYIYTSAQQPIDSGQVRVISINTENFKEIISVEEAT
ncbi:hypothetical protein MKC54_05280 [[Clostridium] innocuum]|nr:hypothetical protein [[Clostridium] innocuum]MCR0576293.1 hypothetical protein [[Clostridium] innocuum]